MTEYGDGIITGKDVFTRDEKQVILKAKTQSERLEKIQNDLTEVNKAFDDVIRAVKNFAVQHKIKDVINRPTLIEIQKLREQYINQVKEELLHSDS